MLLLIFLCVAAYAVYLKFIKPSIYWENKGIFYVKPWWDQALVVLGRKSFFETVTNAYNKFPTRRYYGTYQFLKPALFVRDLDLIKRITVKDFDHFPDHKVMINKKANPVATLNLFLLEGDKWKDMRSTLSPTFTSSKMRSMYILIQDTAEDFANFFSQKGDEVLELEMKKLYSRFTNDIIANCAFGIKCDSLKDENNQFFTMGTTITTRRRVNMLKGIVGSLFPKITQFLRLEVFPSHVLDFFRNIVVETISFREKEKIIRPDMIHLLMEARKGRLKHDTDKAAEKETGFATVEESALGKTTGKIELTDDVITAQVLVFFFAGFETTSTVLSFLSYELALHPDIQRKLQNEIDDAVRRGNGKVTYENVLKLKYLDQVISETLRKYPPGFLLNRICTKDYKIEAKNKDEIDFTLEKGCLINIPVAGIHRDPNYFPDPDKFDPDRFSDENKDKILPASYMPFGNGPRNCIGSRFALLEAKALAVSLFSRFDIVPTKKTPVPLQFAEGMNFSVKGGCWLGLKKRK